MFSIDEYLDIYITRGDIAFFQVTAQDNGKPYKFQVGDIVRIKVFEKKKCQNVVLSKDFPVLTESESVDILLTEEDTKIGGVISKPVDYWYEMELNPYTNPQTIIGYDDDGAKVFKLFPEGKDCTCGTEIEEEDIPIVDAELSLTSERPIQNQAVARAFLEFYDDVKEAKEVIENKKEEAKEELDKYINGSKVAEIGESGVINLIPFPYYRPSGYTQNGITYTYGKDGIIYANGECVGATSYFSLFTRIKPNYKGKATLSLDTNDSGLVSTYFAHYDSANKNLGEVAIRSSDGAITFEMWEDEYEYCTLGVYVPVGNVLNNVPIKVQIEKGSIAHDYMPRNLYYEKEYVTPQMFGARGDGVNDDTLALQMCFNSGYNVIIPTGTYNVSSTLTINTATEYKPHIEFKSAIIKATKPLSPIIKIGGGNTPVIGRPEICGNGIINMNYQNNSIGILIENVACKINGIEVRRAGDNCICLQNGTNNTSTGTLIENCILAGSDSALNCIGLLVNNFDCRYKSIRIAYCQTGIKTYSGTGDFYDDIHIWGHSYSDWSSEVFKKTIGINCLGNFNGGKIYIDSVYTSIITNGRNFTCDTLICGSDTVYDDIPYFIIFKTNQYQFIGIDTLSLFGAKYLVIDGDYSKNQIGRNRIKINIISEYDYIYTPLDFANGSSCNNLTRKNLTTYAAETVEKNKPYLIGYISSDDHLELSVKTKNHDNEKIYKFRENTYKGEFVGTRDFFDLYIGEATTFMNETYRPLYIVFNGEYSFQLVELYPVVTGNSDFYITNREAAEKLEVGILSELTKIQTT